MKYLYLFLLSVLSVASYAQSRSYKVQSPDGKLTAEISLTNQIVFSITHENDRVVAPSEIAMKLSDGSAFGVNPVIRSTRTKTVDQVIASPFYKKKNIKDHYNELQLIFKGDYQLVFRAYNDGIAYRFVSTGKKTFQVVSEEAALNFDGSQKAFLPYVNKEANTSLEEQLWNSFENTYAHVAISEADRSRLAFLPVLVEAKNGKKVCVTESDLEDYPGMYLINKSGGSTLNAFFAAYPKRSETGGHNELQDIVKEREAFIAKVNGPRSFPWRVFVVSGQDKDLTDSDLVYKLASPSKVNDISWIKPGKVAWDWWNDWNITGVNFKSGVNTETYKYYIDFASANKIEYVILDEGWAVNLKADLMQVVPEINLKEIVDYGKSKNVDIILWAGYNAFVKDMEGICKHYADMGVKGFKVDFMDRDDQDMVNFYYRAAQMTAKYKMLIDFHGAYKPTGLNRTYPNVINFEGVHGLEQMKWSAPAVDQVTYDVTIPFIRMVAGPMDYTQGAMRNATRENYRPINSEPMSQGTRCRQLAQYIIFESPLNMLCDAPSNYMAEEVCTKFISAVPTTWDRTVALDGKVAEFVAIARQKGNDWYVGALTNWTQREMELDLSFLPAGNYKIQFFRDGANAHRVAKDFIYEETSLDNRKLKISLAPGGGFVARISSVQN